MLVDIDNFLYDPVVAVITALDDGSYEPKRIAKGLYLADHWNVTHITPNVRNRQSEEEYSELPVPEYGVCGYPEQVLEKFDFDAFPEPVFVSFVCIRKKDQEATGGWRWHKWGDYIGNRQPQCEYIYDEPDIEQVYTFEVIELNKPPLQPETD